MEYFKTALALFVVMQCMNQVAADMSIIQERLVNTTNIVARTPFSTITQCFMKCSARSKCSTIGFSVDPALGKSSECLLLEKVEALGVDEMKGLVPLFVMMNEKVSVAPPPTLPYLKVPDEFAIKKSTLLGSISTLNKEYQVTCDVKPTAFSTTWASVLHVTIGGDNYVYGDRSPGIWFHPVASTTKKTARLYIVSAINGEKNNVYISTEEFVLNKWITIGITQVKEGSDYIFRVYLNGKEAHNVTNTDARTFHDLKVYAADPWATVEQEGFIRNINIDGENCRLRL